MSVIQTNAVLMQVTTSKWTGSMTLVPEFTGDSGNKEHIAAWRKQKKLVSVGKKLIDPDSIYGPTRYASKAYNYLKLKSFPSPLRGLQIVPKNEEIIQGIYDQFDKYKVQWAKEVSLISEQWDQLIDQAKIDFEELNSKLVTAGYPIEFNLSDYPEYIEDEYSLELRAVTLDAPTGLPEAIQIKESANFEKLTEEAQKMCKETLRQRFAEAANLMMEKLSDPEKMKQAKSSAYDNLITLCKDFDSMNTICEDDELKLLSIKCREALNQIKGIKSIKESMVLKNSFQEIFGKISKSIGDLVSGNFKSEKGLRHI